MEQRVHIELGESISARGEMQLVDLNFLPFLEALIPSNNAAFL
jgi:hypothetical protein